MEKHLRKVSQASHVAMHLHLTIIVGVLIAFNVYIFLLVGKSYSGFEGSKPATAATCTVSSKLVNSCRPWLGAAVGKYPQVAKSVRAQAEYHEKRMGRKLDIVHAYHPVGSNLLSADEKYFAGRAGTMIFSNWKPAGNWASAGGGNASVNANIDKMADSVKSLGSKKIFMTIHHEAENDVSGGANGCPTSASFYKGGAGTPAQYRAMWRNVQNRFDARGATNVVWVIDYMNYPPWNCMIDDMYPGNDLVDWVMFNAYAAASTPNFVNNVNRFHTLLNNINSSTNNFKSKPWGIVEWNIRNASAAQQYSYYDQAKAAVEKNTFPRLKAYMIFDSIGPEGNENRVAYRDGGIYDATKQNHYKAFANSNVFSGTTTPPPPPPPPPPSDTTPPTASITKPLNGATVSGIIDFTVKASDNVAIRKVDFIVDTTVIATDTSAPYGIKWDTRKVSNGQHDIKAKAYDTAGNTKTPLKKVTVSNQGSVQPPVINSFSASPSTVNVGSRTTLSWTTSNTVSCSITPGGPTDTTAKSWQTPTFTSTGSRTYNLTCKNSNGQTTSKPATVTVNPATVAPAKPTFSASRTAIKTGESVTFSWSSSRATSCTLNPGNIVATGSSGSKLITSITATTTYSLVCSNNAGSASASPITITVSKDTPPPRPPSIASFTANPRSISKGSTSTLKWSASNVIANGCSLKPSPLTNTGATGQWTTPALTKSTSYTLTCKNSAGKLASKSVSVVVAGQPAPPPPPAHAPSTPPASTSNPVVTAPGGQPVANAQVQDRASDGLITLDPSNLTDTKKIKKILKVEYYEGENLIETVTNSPFALNINKLSVGQHTITERTYFVDGSVAEKTQVITRTVPKGAANTLQSWLIISLVAATTGVAAGVVLYALRNKWVPGFLRLLNLLRGRNGGGPNPPTSIPPPPPGTITG